MIPVTRPKTEPTTRRLAAYTLVELLIVLAIMVLLAAVALPTVKDLLANQQIAKTARNMSAFMDKPAVGQLQKESSLASDWKD